MKILLLLVWSSVTLIKGNSQLISWDTDLNHKETLSNGFCKIQDSKKDHLLITSNEEIVQLVRCKRYAKHFGRKGPSGKQGSNTRFHKPRRRKSQSSNNRNNDALKGKIFLERYGDNHRPYDHHGDNSNRKDYFDNRRPYGNPRDDRRRYEGQNDNLPYGNRRDNRGRYGGQNDNSPYGNRRAYKGQNDDRTPYRDRDNNRGPYRGGKGGQQSQHQGTGGDRGRLYRYRGPYQENASFHGLNVSIGELFQRFSELPNLEKCLCYLDLHSKWKDLHSEWKDEKLRCISLEDENLRLKSKTAIRNEIQVQFEHLAPHWLVILPIKRRWKWRILFQLESEATEQLKSIILLEENLTLEQFCDEMDACTDLAAVDIHIDELPYFETVEKMDSILLRLGYKRKSQRKSLIALAYKFRQKTNPDFYKEKNKYVFLYFPAVKEDITEEEIVSFMKTYVEGYVVPREDITLMITTTKENKGRRPGTIQACVRFPKTVVVHNKPIDVMSALEWLVTETELQEKSNKTKDEETKLKEKEKMQVHLKRQKLVAGKQRVTIPQIFF